MNDSTYFEEYSIQKHLVKCFVWMAIGLLVTAGVAYLMYSTGAYMNLLISLAKSGLSIVMLLPLFIQLGVVIFFSSRLYKMSVTTSKICYLVYSVITGITFSTLPAIYGLDTMFLAFGFTSILFFSLVVIGNTMKLDLTKYSSLIVGALITLIVISVIGIFLNIPSFDIYVCYAAVFIFLIITAYDVQKIKQNYEIARQDDEMLGKLAIYGAFELYLDFINIFLYVLRILGKRK